MRSRQTRYNNKIKITRLLECSLVILVVKKPTATPIDACCRPYLYFKFISASNNSLNISISNLLPYLAYHVCNRCPAIPGFFPHSLMYLLSTEYPARMPGQVKQCEELMVGEGNELVIVVNSLFIDAYFQTREGEDVGTMGGFLGFRTR